MKGSRRRRIVVVVLALTSIAVFASKPSTRAIAEAAPNLTKPGPSDAASQARLVQAYGKLPLSFEANHGQTDGRVKFLSRGSGYTLLLTGDEAVLSLRSQESEVRSQKPEKPASSFVPGLRETKDNGQGTKDVLRMKLVSANRSPRVTGLDELPGKSNYFVGSDPKKWRTDVPSYAKVKYEGVYPGVDLIYYGSQRQLEYDFVVAPGADPKAIALEIETGKSKIETRSSKLENRNPKLAVEASGDLVIETDAGEVRFHKPVVYQEQSSVISRQLSAIGFQSQETSANPKSKIQNRKLLDGRYVLTAGNRIGFQVAAYDKTKPLVIDPVLVYSTYLGGSLGDGGWGVAADSTGNAYITGLTYSDDFPTANAIQPTRGGSPNYGSNAFVTKISADGSALVYSTYLGGSGTPAPGGAPADIGLGIAVDSSGNIYVTGVTNSTDFPTVNAFQPAKTSVQCGPGTGYSYPCGTAFVTKLNGAGDALIYSTYLGGSGVTGGLVLDAGTGIAADSAGEAYVTGYTASTDFPVVNSIQGGYGGGAHDAFVAKFSADGRTLIFSTYLGGSDDDTGSGIALDSAGSAYVTGSTASTDFPTANPIQDTLRGTENGFVAKLDASGHPLIYSTYLGGSSFDQATGIAVDTSGSAYVTGTTRSTDFPLANPLQPDPHLSSYGYFTDAFVTKLDPAGDALVYSTYLGSGNALGTGIAVDSSGNAYVTGDGIVPTVNPIQSCGGVIFVSELNAQGSALVFSMCLNAGDETNAHGIAVDPSGNAYVTGDTFAGNFPTVKPLYTGHGGEPDDDPFVFKIAHSRSSISASPTYLDFGHQVVGAPRKPQTVTLSNPGRAPAKIGGFAFYGASNGDYTQTNNCHSTLAPGHTCIVNVIFAPTSAPPWPAGFRFSWGTLAVTDPGGSAFSVVNVSGGAGSPHADLSPLFPSFGSVTVGTSATLTMTLSNETGSPLTVSGITLAEDNGGSDFTYTNHCPSPVAAWASCGIDVTFTPSAPGGHSATLTVADNAPNSTQTAFLSGSGGL